MGIDKKKQFNLYIVCIINSIGEIGEYYGGFHFVPNVAEAYCRNVRNTAPADAEHCGGIGTQSYGTTIAVVTYDANNHLLPIFLVTSLGQSAISTGR